MKHTIFLFLHALLTGFSFIYAQVADTGTEDLKIKASQVIYEKVYLHVDRSVYVSGEDIWFKA